MKAAELLYAECESRGFLTEYSREIEYRYTELYYAITLFSYMGGVTHPKLAFIRQLRKGVEERFPEFAQNPYYLEHTRGTGTEADPDAEQIGSFIFCLLSYETVDLEEKR